MRGTVIVVTAGAVVLGVAVPSLAMLLAVCLTMVLAFVLGAAAFGPDRSIAPGVVTPFAPTPPADPPTVETPDVTELIREIEASRSRLSPRIVGIVGDVARGRLLDHHRLDLRRSDDRARARELLGDDLASIVLDHDHVELPARALDALLTRLEHL